MSLVVNTNVSAMTAQRHLSQNMSAVESSFEKLSSGYRINHAADDAAGLNISENLRTQIRGGQVALRNTQDGISMLQVAEGAMVTITDNIQRIRELTVQAANDTNSSTERTAIAQEVYQRVQDITRIAASAKFNQINLLDGTASQAKIQIGANSDANSYFDISSALADAQASTLGLVLTSITATGTGAYASGGNIRTFLDTIDSALTTIFNQRSTLGAYESRLDSVISNLSIELENLSASDSRIRDLDIASETTRLTKNQVLQQATSSILAQANQTPQMALRLIG